MRKSFVNETGTTACLRHHMFGSTWLPLGFGVCRSGLSKKELEEECVARGSDGSIRETRARRVGCYCAEPRGDMHGEFGARTFSVAAVWPGLGKKGSKEDLVQKLIIFQQDSSVPSRAWERCHAHVKGSWRLFYNFCRFRSRVCLWRASKSSAHVLL